LGLLVTRREAGTPNSLLEKMPRPWCGVVAQAARSGPSTAINPRKRAAGFQPHRSANTIKQALTDPAKSYVMRKARWPIGSDYGCGPVNLAKIVGCRGPGAAGEIVSRAGREAKINLAASGWQSYKGIFISPRTASELFSAVAHAARGAHMEMPC
jgi:hypothetical protein